MDEQGQRGDLEFGTIPRLARIAAERHGDRPAVEDGEVVLSFAELASRAERVTRACIGAGIEAGDRIAIWAPNCWEWIVAALGVHGAGGVVVPINTRYKGAEAGFVLEKSGARALFTVTEFLDTDYVALLAPQRPKLPALERVVVLRGAAPDDAEHFEAFLARGDDIDPAQARARGDAVDPSDLSDIIFTSGTTGRPKGAMATHAQSLRAFRDWSHVIGLRAGDRYLVVLPFFHTFGYKAGWLSCLMMGATVLPEPVFDVGKVLERVGRDRVSVLPGPPALYQSILLHPKRDAHDLSTLRLAVTGAAVVPVELVRKMRSELGFDTVITGYGLTESTGIVTMCREDDDPEVIAQTSGRAIPDIEVRIIDEEGHEVPRGTPGEVVVRGYTLMKGYFDAPEETAAAIDADGWLRTGDIAVMNDEGYVAITDRKKDMFIVGGFNAYPAEIETQLLEHPQVAEAAVVGVPDERLGEVGMAFLVPRPGEALKEDEVIAWCREHMANFKVPRKVVLMDALPRNATGKVQKFKLREQPTPAPRLHG